MCTIRLRPKRYWGATPRENKKKEKQPENEKGPSRALSLLYTCITGTGTEHGHLLWSLSVWSGLLRRLARSLARFCVRACVRGVVSCLLEVVGCFVCLLSTTPPRLQSRAPSVPHRLSRTVCPSSPLPSFLPSFRVYHASTTECILIRPQKERKVKEKKKKRKSQSINQSIIPLFLSVPEKLRKLRANAAQMLRFR